MSAATFDFSRTRCLDSRVESRLSAWLDFFRRDLSRLEPSLRVIPECQVDPIETATFSDFVSRWDGRALGCYVEFGLEPTRSLLTISDRHARLLVGRMLGLQAGEAESADTAEGTLTPVEHSMVELFVDELCKSLTEAWPESDPPAITTIGFETDAARSRFVTKKSELVSLAFSLTFSDCPVRLQWLLPPSAFGSLGELPARPPTAESRRNLESVIKAVPVELTVHLGQAKLRLRDITLLRSGDLILLNRKLGQPMPASIGIRKRFEGWPGRIGGQQAYQIQQVLGGRRRDDMKGIDDDK